MIVANPRQLRLIYENQRKSDRTDAEYLARLARVDPKLLAPITHRGEQAQADLALLRSRDMLVRARADLVNHVRGAVKSVVFRIPKCSTPAFARRAKAHVPELLEATLRPVLSTITQLSEQIHQMDRQIEQVAQSSYPICRCATRTRVRRKARRSATSTDVPTLTTTPVPALQAGGHRFDPGRLHCCK